MRFNHATRFVRRTIGVGSLKRVTATLMRAKIASEITGFLVNNNPAVNDSYASLKERFIRNGQSHTIDQSQRAEIVRRFERLNAAGVPIATTPTDGLFLAEMILNTSADGPIIECGCYAGGSSAKLSIIAKATGRELIVCDSFEGLPKVEGYDRTDAHARRHRYRDWAEGRFGIGLEGVQANIERFGELSVCRFVKGWFSDTLTDANIPPTAAFVFADVDIPNSVRDCLTALWPRLSHSGVYAIHDAPFVKVLQEIYRRELWENTFHEWPPILFGAGYGLCDRSPHLGYMVKGDVSPEYLKSLTINK